MGVEQGPQSTEEVRKAAAEAAANAQEEDPRSKQGAQSLMELANN
jgi:hypothetical protein